MAKWRALHASITTDGKVNRLSEFGQLLYDRIVVRADDWGIITGDTFELKGETIPLSSRTFEEIGGALGEMTDQSLIWQYEPESFGPLVQVRKFDDHQPKALIQKRTAPKLPLHPDWRPMTGDTRSLSLLQEVVTTMPTIGEILQQVIGNECLDKTRIDNSKEEENKQPCNDGEPFSQIFTEVTGVLVATGVQAEEMDTWMQDVTEDWFRDACKEAVDNNARKWSYIRAILKRWKKEGKKKKYAKTKRGRSTPTIDYDKELKRQAAEAELDA